jgi:hypothetical protein
MKRLSLILFVLIVILTGLPGAAQGQAGGWEPVIPDAIDYQAFLAAGPNEVFVTRMHRDNPNVIIDSSLGQGRLSGGTETVTNMAKRYDQAINYWGETWGGRNEVVVGINGFFYGPDEEPPGVPWSGQIQSGWYTKRFDDWGSGFDWRLDRTAFIGRCVNHRADKQLLTHIPSGETIQIDGINEGRGGNELILFTPQYDLSTGTDNSGLEILVEMGRPTLIIPAPNPGSPPRYVTGTVQAILSDQGNTPIPFDHVVLSAKGTARAALEGFSLSIGDQIGINQEITHYEIDCATPAPSEVGWTKSYASIGGYPIVLRAGEIPDFEAEGVEAWEFRNPRTAIALNDDFIYFIVVDGRNPGISEGMNYPELAAFARDTLGADWAINQDGGGSSTMWIQGHVVNNTYCNNSNCLPDDSAEGEKGPQLFFLDPDEINVFLPMVRRAPVIQRQVANGMLMIVYEPLAVSALFAPDEIVRTVIPTEIRLGPGSNYASLATLAADSEGQVLAHTNGLGGVQAKGSYWWKVNFSGTVGWVAEEALISFNWLTEARFDSFFLPGIINPPEE